MGKRKEDVGLSGKESSSFLSVSEEKEDTMQEVIAVQHTTEDEAKVKITQEVLDHLATFGITADSSEQFDGLVRSLVEARLKDRAVAEESKPKKKAKGEALPPAKQLALDLVAELPVSEDKAVQKENFLQIAVLAEAALIKLYEIIGADAQKRLTLLGDYADRLKHYETSVDSLCYMLERGFQFGKSAGVIDFGRKRNSKKVESSVAETPTTATEDIPRLEESDNIPF